MIAVHVATGSDTETPPKISIIVPKKASAKTPKPGPSKETRKKAVKKSQPKPKTKITNSKQSNIPQTEANDKYIKTLEKSAQKCYKGKQPVRVMLLQRTGKPDIQAFQTKNHKALEKMGKCILSEMRHRKLKLVGPIGRLQFDVSLR